MVRTFFLVLLLFVFAIGTVAAQGRLSNVREDVQRSPASPADSQDSDDSGSSSSSNNDGGSDSTVGIYGAIVLSPFYIPAMLLNDRDAYRLYFAPHPYALKTPIYQLADPTLATLYYAPETDHIPRNNWAVRLALEDGNDFTGINRFAGQFKLEHANRWGINSNWNWFVERLPCGCIDETVISDTNITCRFAQHEMGSFYAGLGFRMLTDRHVTDFGFNFTYGGDWFPVRPIVVSALFDAGTLGHAGVVHGRASIGAIWQGWEVYAGYDFLRIGSVNLQGPMVGVRWWF